MKRKQKLTREQRARRKQLRKDGLPPIKLLYKTEEELEKELHDDLRAILDSFLFKC